MKKMICVFLKTFMLICSLVFLVSCSQPSSGDGSGVSSTNKSEYTIMIYGAGGGDLDLPLLNVLDQIKFYKEINGFDFNKINITAQFNMSDLDTSKPKKDNSGNPTGEYELTPYQQEGSEYKGTMRWYMTKDGWNKDNNFGQVQTLHNPDVLTDFIQYSKNKFPAEKYILILKDHGYCFDIREQPVDSPVTKTNARGVVFDTNNGNANRPLSIFGIEEGIKNSGVKMELIYFDCCLMGQVEMLYQIRNQTNYVLSSSNSGWSTSNYGNFLNGLLKKSNIVEAMDQYLNKAVEYWRQTVKVENITTSFGMDMVLTDMSKIENFADKFIKVKEAFIKAYYSKELTEDQKIYLAKSYKPSRKQMEALGGGITDTELLSPEWQNGRLYYFDFFNFKNDAGINQSKEYTDVDIRSAFSYFATEEPDFLIHVNNMLEALDELMVSAVCAFEPDFITEPSIGLMFIDKQRFEYDYFLHTGLGSQKYPSIKSCYKELAWDKKTGWSEFFEKNIAP